MKHPTRNVFRPRSSDNYDGPHLSEQSSSNSHQQQQRHNALRSSERLSEPSLFFCGSFVSEQAFSKSPSLSEDSSFRQQTPTFSSLSYDDDDDADDNLVLEARKATPLFRPAYVDSHHSESAWFFLTSCFSSRSEFDDGIVGSSNSMMDNSLYYTESTIH